MLAFYYLLTVLSIVHFRAPADVKRLWPLVLGVPLAAYATRDANAKERTRRAVRATFATAMVAGIYVALAGSGLVPGLSRATAFEQS